jgi:hypothetical protein
MSNAPAFGTGGATLGSALPFLRWTGTWRLRRAVLVLVGIAALSLVGTIVIGRDPGFLIAFLLVVGTVVAAVGVERRAVHKLIPLPALCYLVTTTVAGTVHDWSFLNDSKELITSFLTWIGSGFFGLVAAIVLVVLITFIRWLASRLLVSGQLPPAPSGPGRTGSGPASGGPWTGRGPATDGPRRGSGAPGNRGPRDRGPGGNAFGSDRDTWGGNGPRGDSRATRAPGDDRYSRGQRAERPPRDGQGYRNGQGQRRFGDSPEDDHRPRASGVPRDLW